MTACTVLSSAEESWCDWLRTNCGCTTTIGPSCHNVHNSSHGNLAYTKSIHSLCHLLNIVKRQSSQFILTADDFHHKLGDEDGI